MKGLTVIPSELQLLQAYNELQSWIHTKNNIIVNEHHLKKLAEYSQWARFDPRLGEIWVHTLSLYWKLIPPFIFNQELNQLPWPSAGAVLLEHVEFIILARDRKMFQLWKKTVSLKIIPSQGELFFIGTLAFAGNKVQTEAEFATGPYRAWGYLGQDILINKFNLKNNETTLFNAQQRKKLIELILQKKSKIQVSDLIAAGNGWISRRQAQLDLKAYFTLKKLKIIGNTQARYYKANPLKK